WEGAAREWATALAVVPAQLSTAVGQLVDAPVDRREGVIQVLTGASDAPAARQLGAALLLSWGDPQRAWAVFEPTVSGRSVDAAYALRSFADWAMGQRTRAGWRVRGLALRELARRVPPELAVRMRADAARAFLEAGDVAAAQAELALVAADPAAAPDAQRLAQATLIRALIQAGQLDSAAAQLERARDQLLNDDRTTVRLALARARIRRGDLARADSALGADSSLEASAVRGWIALYRGDLPTASAPRRRCSTKWSGSSARGRRRRRRSSCGPGCCCGRARPAPLRNTSSTSSSPIPRALSCPKRGASWSAPGERFPSREAKRLRQGGRAVGRVGG